MSASVSLTETYHRPGNAPAAGVTTAQAGDFLGHEIKGPAASIQMIAAALRDCLSRLQPQEAQSLCDAIIAEAVHLARLAEVLDASGALQPDSGLVPCDVSEVVVKAAERVRRHPDARCAEIRLGDDQGVPPALANPYHLQLVVFNLLLNAAQATDGRGPVEVRLRAGTGSVVLEVNDDGMGVGGDGLASRIWEPGYSTKGSTGMGLNICKMLVGACGGRIWAESGPSAGSRFLVELKSVRD